MFLAQDIRYALRTMRQSPAFTAVAVASLALGIGANTAIFSMIDAILLRWLPVSNPQELVALARNPSRPSTSFTYPDYRFIRDQSKSYAGLIAYSGGQPVSFRLPGGSGDAQIAAMAMVTGNYFDVLGVTPALGRVFNSADNEKEGAHPYAVLSHHFWQRSFGADTSVIGREMLLNGTRFQIAGVARAGFAGAQVGMTPDLYVPIMMYRTFRPTATYWNTRMMQWLSVMGRLKPGVPRDQAAAEYAVLWQRIMEENPSQQQRAAWNQDFKLRNTTVMLPGNRGTSYMRNEAAKPLYILLLTSGLVLLIACANIANLVLARGIARRKEIAVRLAIGAARARIVTQMLVESVMLAVLGGVAGMAVAWAGVRVLLTFLPRDRFEISLDLTPDWRVGAFAFAISLLSGMVFGLIPAMRASKPDLALDLKVDSGTAGRLARWDLRRSLVSFQVALSLVLLAGAGLFVRTLANLRDQDPGMARENLLLVNTNIDQFGYQPQRERQFHEELIASLQRENGVRAASLAAITPLSGSRWNNNIQIEGYTWRPDEPPFLDINAVTPRYFEAAGIPIVLGRDFNEPDHLGVLPDRPAKPPAPGETPPDVPGPPRVVIVNEAFARKFFGGASAIGRRVCNGTKWDAARTAEIVGVVRDARYFDLREPVEPMVYHPAYRESGRTGGVITIRTTGEPTALVDTVRRKIREIDPNVAITESRSMADNLHRNLIQERIVATLGGFFGLVALVLAAVGLYGVMSQMVTGRTREIGIRMALGAEAAGVLGLVLREAFWMVALGAMVGIPVVLWLMRFAGSVLFGIKPQDPLTLIAACGILAGATAVAGFLPARRATRVEPMAALRQE